MKLIVLFGVFALAAARRDHDHDHERRPRPPAVVVKHRHDVGANETYEFKFAFLGMEALNETEVWLYKVDRNSEPHFIEAEFEIYTETLTNETDVKEWLDNFKKEADKEREDRDSDREEGDREKDGREHKRRPRPPHPRPHPKFTNAVVGEITIESASCDDMGPYFLHYGEIEEREEREDDDEDRRKHRRPHPRPPRGAFYISVEDCQSIDF